MPVSLNALDTEVDTKAAKADFSVTTGASGQTALTYDNATGVFSLTPVLGLTDLGISDGTAGHFLTTDGAGNFSFAPNGSPPLSALSVTTATAATPSSLTYDDTTGVFTYTPEDISAKIELTNLEVLTAANSGSGALTYDNTIGRFTYTPPLLPVVNTPNKYLSVDGSTTTFTIQTNHTVDTCLVFYNGVCLVPTDDYTVSGTTLTTTFTPIAGSDIVIRYLPI
jgi:hypothetical protein